MQEIIDFIKNAKHLIAFTGAGVLKMLEAKMVFIKQ